jgi:Uri superfamily endonuclease
MKGIYVLVISIRKNISVNVGALDTVVFEKGLYAYVGSAQNNVKKRIERHLRRCKPKFWHIDYLLSNDAATVLNVFFKEGARSEECQVSRQIAERGIPIRRFGSSDCRCDSHLFKIEHYEVLSESMHEITVQSS